jgi:cytochrome b561/cytochrome b involved in lipid metabolism
MAPLCKSITRAEVAKHTGVGGTDPWIILHNVVYDVAAWLQEHPGGNAILMENAGQDATQAFEDQGHSKVAMEIRKTYEIGELVPDEWSLWTRAFRSVDTQRVESLDFCYSWKDQQWKPLSQRWPELMHENGIAPSDGKLTLRNFNGDVVVAAESLPENQFPLRGKYLAGTAGGFAVLPKLALAALAVAYVNQALQSRPIPAVTYSKALRHVHVLMAAGAAASIWTVQAATKSEDKSRKQEWIELHKKSGVLMLAAIVARIWLRIRSAVPPAFPGPQALQHLEHGSHKAFYALMLLLPLTGVAYGYTGGTGVPLLGSKTDPTKEDLQTAQSAIDLHRLLGRLFECVWLPFHLGAEAYHYSNGRDVVRRITPFL